MPLVLSIIIQLRVVMVIISLRDRENQNWFELPSSLRNVEKPHGDLIGQTS